jgi:hypothetical protein
MDSRFKNDDPKARGKHFIGTYNNWNIKLNPDESKALQMLYCRTKAQYLCGQAEVGHEGTPHLQFYCYFPKKMGVGALGKKFNCYFAVAKDYRWVERYCTKMETRVGGPFYFG